MKLIATRYPGPQTALHSLLLRAPEWASRDAAVSCVRLSAEEAGEWLQARAQNHAEFTSTTTELAMGGESDCYEVAYEWYSASGELQREVIGAVLTHQNGGRAYAIHSEP